jgi:hypothetical protein
MGNKGNKMFKPSKLMIYYWVAYAMPDVKPEVTDACRKALELMKSDGVTDLPSQESYRQYTYRWDDIEGYNEWKKEFWEELMVNGEQFLDKVGMMKSLSDFRYWEGMQTKYFNFRKGQDVTSGGKEVKSIKVNFVGNTDGLDELRDSDGLNGNTQEDNDSPQEGQEGNMS